MESSIQLPFPSKDPVTEINIGTSQEPRPVFFVSQNLNNEELLAHTLLLKELGMCLHGPTMKCLG